MLITVMQTQQFICIISVLMYKRGTVSVQIDTSSQHSENFQCLIKQTSRDLKLIYMPDDNRTYSEH